MNLNLTWGPFTIRQAVLSDGRAVKNLMTSSLEHKGIHTEEYHREYSDLDLEDVVRAYEGSNGAFLVAELGDKLVGSLGFFTVDGMFAQLRRFHVHPDFRGMGIERALLEYTFFFCVSKGFTGIITVTEVEVKRAFKMYSAAGFKVFESAGIGYMAKFFAGEKEGLLFSGIAEKNWIFDFDRQKWKERK